jgi:ATP-dependent HslUV protease subunit HslV
MTELHGTTILSVRRNGVVAVGGDGQVSLGNTVMKSTRAKCAGLYDGKVLAGFAGGTADAFTLFERFEAKLQQYGNLTRAAIELAKDWRTDRSLRPPRSIAVRRPTRKAPSIVSGGNGDVIEPGRTTIMAIGLRRRVRASRRTRPWRSIPTFDAKDDRGKIAQASRPNICIYTNRNLTIEELK